MADANLLKDKTILITGGTGSFGKCFSRYVLEHYEPKKIIVYSRDEYKQFVMSNDEFFKAHADKMRYFIGDVRDCDRLKRALEGTDYCIHAAALKQVPACEYNPAEAIKTNVGGAQNVIDASLDTGVKKVVALSTDKAVNPVNLYGGTKLVSDKLFIAANAYAGSKDINFSIVRYGNVAGSRGSVIPFFRSLIERGETTLPITDYRMTRFWISLEQGVELVIKALAEAMLPGCTTKETGIRPGEKLHEVMITPEDSATTYEFEKNYVIYPQITYNDRQVPDLSGKKVEDGFAYSSGNNKEWMSVDEIRERLREVTVC